MIKRAYCHENKLRNTKQNVKRQGIIWSKHISRVLYTYGNVKCLYSFKNIFYQSIFRRKTTTWHKNKNTVYYFSIRQSSLYEAFGILLTKNCYLLMEDSSVIHWTPHMKDVLLAIRTQTKKMCEILTVIIQYFKKIIKQLTCSGSILFSMLMSHPSKPWYLAILTNCDTVVATEILLARTF